MNTDENIQKIQRVVLLEKKTYTKQTRSIKKISLGEHHLKIRRGMERDIIEKKHHKEDATEEQYSKKNSLK